MTVRQSEIDTQTDFKGYRNQKNLNREILKLSRCQISGMALNKMDYSDKLSTGL